MRRKYFVRTVFMDFFFMHRISFMEKDAQLFVTVLASFLEMTKFHRKILFVLKSILKIFRSRYNHIRCKIKLKGKMQYRRRTKKIFLARDTIPLNVFYNIQVEYAQGA